MKYSQYFFINQRRDSGKDFVALKDETPQILRDLVRDIHMGYFDKCMPNDWIYATIFEAFDALENDDLENCSIESDIYHYDLIEWLHNPFAPYFCDTAIEHLGKAGENIMSIISNAQFLAKENIYYAVNDFLQTNQGDYEEADNQGT